MVGERRQQLGEPPAGGGARVQVQVEVAQREVGGQQVQARHVRGAQVRLELTLRADQLRRAALQLRLDAEEERRRPLRIEVPDEHAASRPRRLVRQVEGRRGLPDAALDAVGRDDLHAAPMADLRPAVVASSSRRARRVALLS